MHYKLLLYNHDINWGVPDQTSKPQKSILKQNGIMCLLDFVLFLRSKKFVGADSFKRQKQMFLVCNTCMLQCIVI